MLPLLLSLLLAPEPASGFAVCRPLTPQYLPTAGRDIPVDADLNVLLDLSATCPAGTSQSVELYEGDELVMVQDTVEAFRDPLSRLDLDLEPDTTYRLVQIGTVEGVTETTFTTGTRTATPAPDVELSDLTVSHVKVEGKYRITVNATVRGPTLPADPDLMLELSHEGTVFQVTTSQAVPVGGDTTRILQGGRMLELDDLPDEICVTATAINVAGARGESDTLCAESERSGGCASLSAPPTWLVAGLPLLVLARRRR